MTKELWWGHAKVGLGSDPGGKFVSCLGKYVSCSQSQITNPTNKGGGPPGESRENGVTARERLRVGPAVGNVQRKDEKRQIGGVS